MAAAPQEGRGGQRAVLRRRLGVLALVAVAMGWFMHGPSEQANAHYSLVRALEQGKPYVDETRFEVGDLSTIDLSRSNGHYYSQKAPGLAFVTVPVYAAAKALGMRTTGDPTRMLWLLGLFGSVLPAAIMLFFVASIGDEHAPGWGTVAAATIGLATIVLPFAGLFYAHVFSASIAFLAFAALWFERRHRSTALLVLGGFLAGFAIVAEYQLILVSAILAVYAASLDPRPRRLLTFGAGAVAGVLPLFAFNTWAFGSPFGLSYYSILESDRTRTATVDDWWAYLVEPPSPRSFLAALIAKWGLFAATPVLVLAAAGIRLLWRRERATGRVVAAVAGVMLALVTVLYATAYGDTFAPRYLIAVLPFLGIPLALAYREWPALGVVLAVPSLASMALVTATRPLTAWQGDFLHRLTEQGGPPQSVPWLLGFSGWYVGLPFFAIVAAAALLAARGVRVRLTERDRIPAAAGFAAWSFTYAIGPGWLLSEEDDLWRLLVTAAVAVVALRAFLHIAQLPSAAVAPAVTTAVRRPH